jgi:hypothetical protein
MGPPLDGKEPLHRLFTEGVNTQAIEGIGGVGHHATVPEDGHTFFYLIL